MSLRPSSFPRAAAALLLVAGAASAQQHSDSQMEQAWRHLSPAERREAVEWFRYELEGLDTLPLRLVRHVSKLADVDPGFWPDAGPAPFFAPGGKRKRLAADSERDRELSEMLGLPEPPLWTYDFATRRLVRHPEVDDPDRVLRAALAGRHPDREYAQAQVERMLDDGRYLDSFAALAHGYSHEDGAVHPHVTLYDVLASGEALPIAETDALEIARWILGDESPWTAPVPLVRRPELDRLLLELYDEAEAWRDVVRVAARAYFEPDVTAEYAPDPLLLHALWLSAESEPEMLARRLPGPDRRARFFEDWSESFRTRKLRTNATYRQRDLLDGAAPVRALFDRILTELGGYEARGDAPAPEPEPPAAAPAADDPDRLLVELDPEAEADLLDRIGKVSRSRRRQVLERCLEAAEASGARQVELVARWTEGLDRDDLPEPTEYGAHDPKDVGGGGPKRRMNEPGDKRWDRLAAKISFDPSPPWPRRAVYEMATGRITQAPPPPVTEAPKRGRRKAADDDEHEEVVALRLLLAGVLPEQDLAQAAVAKALDAGAGLRREAVYFAHLYTDRDGNAFAGITLGDAWSSDFELEVPDVDALAYIRGIWDDESVRPPLSDADHDVWYPRIAASLEAWRHRSHVLRSLATVWFEGRPDLPHGYDASIDLMHAAIARADEDAAALAERLETDGLGFLQKSLREISGLGNEGWNAGNDRRDELSRGAARIRRAVIAALAEEGLLRE